ncbi:MAG: hypothetical protein JSV42_10735 [Chloroflexota bacterium]|nr:MAG: hypothetical protein JSV42_10735 [Chloroflexota bacterium]
MKNSFAAMLDQVLAQEFSGEPREQVLQAFPRHRVRLEPLLKTARILTCIQEVQFPGWDSLRDDRRRFLRAVNQVENSSVSPGLVDRINSWITTLIPFNASRPRSTHQEKRKMSAIIANLALLMALLLASAGGTVAAAAGSLPDSPLYQVKLAIEQVQVDFIDDPEQIAAKHLELAQNRLQEMLLLAKQGSPVQDDCSLRLQEHFNFALQYAAQLDEVQMAGLLTRAQHLLQNQLQEMEQVRSQLKVQQQDPLAEPERILQRTQARVQAGLEDPLAFRKQARFGFGETGGNPDCPEGECLPTGDEYHSRLRRGHPHPRLNRNRVRFSGPAQEDQTPLEGLIGEQDCDTCLPIGDANRFGQDPSGDPGYGPGQPGGNLDPDCEDCTPSGDEHKYGQQPGSDQDGDTNGSGQGSAGSGGDGSAGNGSENGSGSSSDDSSGSGGEGSGGSGRP